MEPARKLPRFVVWYEHATAKLCVGDRKGVPEDQMIPEDRVMHLKVDSYDILLQSIFTALENDEAGAANVLFGAVQVAENEALRWMTLAAELRGEFAKRGAGIGENRQVVGVSTLDMAKRLKFEKKVRECRALMDACVVAASTRAGTELAAKLGEALDELGE